MLAVLNSKATERRGRGCDALDFIRPMAPCNIMLKFTNASGRTKPTTNKRRSNVLHTHTRYACIGEAGTRHDIPSRKPVNFG